MRTLPCFLWGLLSCVASVCFAGEASVGLIAKDPINAPDATSLTTDPLVVAETAVAGTSSAFGSANLIDGVLKAVGVSGPPFIPGEPGLSSTFAQAAVSFGDTFTFSGGYGETAYLDWLFEGSITTNPDRPVVSFSAAEFSIDVRRDGSDAAFLSYLSTNGPDCATFSGTFCSDAPSVSAMGSLPILIAPGSFSVQASLVAGAVLGDTVLFGNTARLFLRLPDGVSIASTSGQFLATAAPVLVAVPEPETFVLMLVGLGTLATRRVRGPLREAERS